MLPDTILILCNINIEIVAKTIKQEGSLYVKEVKMVTINRRTQGNLHIHTDEYFDIMTQNPGS